LERKNYVEVDLVGAPDLATAEEIYFSRYETAAETAKSAATNASSNHPGHPPSPRRRVLSPFASESLGPS
jgi:hypothetical protein